MDIGAALGCAFFCAGKDESVTGIKQRLRGAWGGLQAAGEKASRKTASLPTLWTPYRRVQIYGQGALPKATAANLRRFAEVPVARRAINVVKDRIAGMDWQVRLKREAEGGALATERLRILRETLEAPNPGDSFRTLIEQVLEDVIVGGFGALEMELTPDARFPFRLWPVDGATVQVNADWDGSETSPRYAQVHVAGGVEKSVPLLDRELIYIRLNPRTHTPFGLGRLEVAFESIRAFLEASRYAGRMAGNGVQQFALWLEETTPEQHERMVRWWQDEVEGTGQIPILSTEKKPEVLRFTGGTDADLHLGWQEFLLRMIANAFDLPPMMLGLEHDVNRATAAEMADDAFESAIKPVAKLLAEHLTRDLFGKCLGMGDVEFVFNDLLSRDEMTETSVQLDLLKAGVVTVEEVRAMRGL
jgi:phage portal protein BeeE